MGNRFSKATTLAECCSNCRAEICYTPVSQTVKNETFPGYAIIST